MTDLLLQQAHPATSVRLKPNLNAAVRTGTKSTQCRSDTSQLSLTTPMLKAIDEASDLWSWYKDGMTRKQRELVRQTDERKDILCARMKEWEDAAKELDILEGNNEWKKDPATADYNQALIEQRLRELDDARHTSDLRSMVHLIRTALSRDLGGMGNVELYRHSYVGSKTLIERYVESAIGIINAVINQSSLDQGIDHRDLLEGMLYARQAFGRSALLLSGGGTFGMSHIGVVKALFEARLLPRIISGASAGSIVSAVLCTKSDDEVPEMLAKFPFGDLDVFESGETKEGVLDHLRRLLTEGSWSDIKHLTRVMRDLTGEITFQEAYNRTRRILNICVSTESVYELPRLLNYVTAPNVMIWSAVAASCSVPLIFNSSPLLVKDPVTGEHRPWNPTPHHFIDGSVDNDLPMTRLSEMFNVNHFIVSQVNPHVVPFLEKNDHLAPGMPHPGKLQTNDLDWGYAISSLAKEEALHRLQFLAEIGLFPNLATKFRSILSQKYSGDITIMPKIRVSDLPLVLTNPTPTFMQRACLMGERATWPKLSRIRDQCAIELALDRAVHQLRTRVVFSESQRDLRRLGTSSSGARLGVPALTAQTSNVPPPSAQNQTRHRTRSGGSLLLVPPDRRMLLGAADVTDDDTAEEEQQELRARRGRTVSPGAARKPRLKRASKSNHHVPQHRKSALLTPRGAADRLDFDFSKPPTPPSERGRSPRQSEARASPASQARNSIEQTASPIDDIPTSVADDRSSEADGEQGTEHGTEESDPDMLDGRQDEDAAGQGKAPPEANTTKQDAEGLWN